MDVYEVTNALYKQFCDATGRAYPVNASDGYFLEYPEYPAVNVNWEDAAAYAAWAGKSLPTEAAWEYAARGGLNGRLYPWGDESPSTLCNCYNYSGSLYSQMAPFWAGRAASLIPNPFSMLLPRQPWLCSMRFIRWQTRSES